MPGTVVVEDHRGTLSTPASGSIAFWLGGRGGERREARIDGGAFVLEMPNWVSWIDIGEIEADGIACFTIPPWEIGSMPERADLVARRVKPAQARFVDGETGTDLHDVTLATPELYVRDPVTIVLASVASPVEVPLFAGVDEFPRGWIGLREYVVTSPGRATKRVWIDPTEGGTRTYVMAKEAQLEVRTQLDATEAARYEVQIARGGRPDLWAIERVPPSGTVHFRGLPAGSWTARLALADAPLDGGFARARAELEAGESQTLDVRLDPSSEAVKSTDLRGTLRLPEGVDPKSIRIEFAPGRVISAARDPRVDPRGTPRPPDVEGDLLFADPRDPRLFHWYACRAAAGEWQVSIVPLHWSKSVTFGNDEPVELVVESAADLSAPPVETVVRIVDGPSGRELGKSDVDVSVAGPGGSVRCAVGETRWRVVTHSPRFRLAVERVADERAKTEFQVDGTGGEVSLTMWPRQQIELRVYDGEALVGSPEIVGELGPSAAPIGHAGRAICAGGTRVRENRTYYCVEGPGRYRVALRGDARYAPTKEVEVEVESGAPPPVAVFHLERKGR